MHTRSLRRTFAWLIKVCRENNVQLFATTQSLETIDAMIDVCKDEAMDLVAYRLEQGKRRQRQRDLTGSYCFACARNWVWRFDKGP
jgi:AAA15 family ATPase/GTPase